MKVGVFFPLILPAATPDYLRTLATAAEESGVNRLWVADPHVAMFDTYSSRHPHSEGGEVEAREEPDAFQALAFVAAVTRRLRLGTGICVVPQRNPVYTAKSVTTLDHLSHGRFDFGVGLGVLQEEFGAVGVPWPHRAQRCREYLKVMLSLWQDSISDFRGDFYSLPKCRQAPLPVQKPHPPIYFGGESDAALGRVAEFGQGWFPVNLSPEEVTERLRRLESLLAERGRRRTEIEVSVLLTRQMTPEAVRAYARAGVDELVPYARIPALNEIVPTLAGIVESATEAASGP
jgi:probable F420-dependent oxidoreductase